MYRILVVEDDPGIAQAVCAHLRQWELEARCVQNFRAVMDEFTAFDPQLVLLDISLPVFQRLSLVHADPQRLARAGHVPLVRGGEYEHRHGDEHGRGRFHRQAL